MRFDRERIYEIELNKALDEGYQEGAAKVIAWQRADEKFYELADMARAEAKDRDFD